MFGSFPLNHVGDCLTGQVQKGLNVQKVGRLRRREPNMSRNRGKKVSNRMETKAFRIQTELGKTYQNKLEQGRLINLHKVFLPAVCLVRTCVIRLLMMVEFAVLDNFSKNSSVDLTHWDFHAVLLSDICSSLRNKNRTYSPPHARSVS